MMKKIILLTMAVFVILLGITGCGGADSKNYSEDIQKIRNQTVGILQGKTFGDILDVALEDAEWSDDDNYSIESGAVMVTGKDVETGQQIEIIWLKKAKVASSNFEKMTKDGKSVGYSQFLSYLRSYEEQVKE